MFTQAQAKKVKPYKPPQLFSSIGSFSGIKTADTEDGIKALSMPLIIRDSVGLSYTISSYQFLYRQKSKIEDEVTGDVKPTSTITSQLFKATPLPSLWIERIGEQLKSGEELYFFDIIVKDSKGQAMYAPDLRITIK